MLTGRLGVASLALTLAGLGACGTDSVGLASARFTKTYALATVNGAPLPATFQDGSELHVFLADTLRFTGDGRVQMIQIRQIAGTTRTELRAFQYRINRGHLEVGFFGPCNDTSMCLGFITGTISESAVTMFSMWSWPGPDSPILEFRRVAGE